MPSTRQTQSGQTAMEQLLAAMMPEGRPARAQHQNTSQPAALHAGQGVIIRRAWRRRRNQRYTGLAA